MPLRHRQFAFNPSSEASRKPFHERSPECTHSKWGSKKIDEAFGFIDPIPG
jgi:hypothetical protein